MRKIKLIWDFRGPTAEGTAKHHAIHLEEFGEKEHIKVDKLGHECLNEMHWTAYMIIDEGDMPPVRDALKPHRGEVAH